MIIGEWQAENIPKVIERAFNSASFKHDVKNYQVFVKNIMNTTPIIEKSAEPGGGYDIFFIRNGVKQDAGYGVPLRFRLSEAMTHVETQKPRKESKGGGRVVIDAVDLLDPNYNWGQYLIYKPTEVLGPPDPAIRLPDSP
jgi:hypothetical protein